MELANEAAKYGRDLNLTTSGEADEDEMTSGDGRTIPKGNQRHFTAAQNLAIQRELNEDINALIKQKRASDPAKYGGLRTTATVLVTPKSNGKTKAAYQATITHILSLDGARSSQTTIRSALASAKPPLASPKDWNKPLPSWAVEQWRKLVRDAPPPFNQIRVTRRTTLSSLHREAIALAARDSKEGVVVQARILVTKDRLHIGNQSWKIGRETGRASVTIKGLLTLAQQDKIARAIR